MNRRDFTRRAIAVLGLSALPSALRAAGEGGGLGASVPVPGVQPPMPAMAIRGLVTHPTFRPLLDRARAALDAHGDRFAQRDRIGLADFTQASTEHRFHIVDLTNGQAISYLVAHGRGSDPDFSGYLQSFSNEPDSNATSEGAFITGPVYEGVHGASMRLLGLDATNSNAEARAIVVHGAPYVSEDHIATFGKTGRSEGCFAVAPHLIAQVLALLGPDRLLYAAKV